MSIAQIEVVTESREHQLKREFAEIVSEHKRSAWRIGDKALEIQEEKRAQLQAEADELRRRADNCTDDEDGQAAKKELLNKAAAIEGRGLVHYTKEICDANRIEAGYVQNCVALATFYKPQFRNGALTPAHHIAALKAAGGMSGDLGKAQTWLSEAEQHDYTASELRRRVNMAIATAKPPTTAPEPEQYAELDRADAWCIHHQNDRVERDVASTLCTRWQALIAYVHIIEGARG